MSSFSKICRQDSSSRPDASGTPEGRSLLERFNRYNALIFDGRLSVPKLKWSRARTRLGQMACKRKTSLRRTKYYDYTISVSTYYELTEEQTDDVLIHEMIHYSIAYGTERHLSAWCHLPQHDGKGQPAFWKTHHRLRQHTQSAGTWATTAQGLSGTGIGDERRRLLSLFRQSVSCRKAGRFSGTDTWNSPLRLVLLKG